jgi:hypothetical protein
MDETGLPGRPMMRRAADAAKHHRLARAHGDLPERHIGAKIGQNVLHVIMIPHRSAAGGHDDIDVLIQCATQMRGDVFRIIRRNAQMRCFRTGLFQHGGHAIHVRGYNLVWPARLPRFDELVTCREQSH